MVEEVESATDLYVKGKNRVFRFGAGDAQESLGTLNFRLPAPGRYVSAGQPYDMAIALYIANSEAPLLISRQTLTNMSAQLDFIGNTIKLHGHRIITLISTDSGHMQLPAEATDWRKGQNASKPLFPVTQDLGNEMITDAELKRIRLHLGQRSGHVLRNMLRAAHRPVTDQQIHQLPWKRSCSEKANRATPPKISSWISRFNGEIIGVDVVYPFVGSRPYNIGKEITSLLIACVLADSVCARCWGIW